MNEPADNASPSAVSSDEITEDEFEELLDKLHGEGSTSNKTEE